MGSVIDDTFNGGRARSEQDKADSILRDNADYMAALKAPEIKWETYNPEAFNPDLIDYRTVSEDPAVRAMQMKSLEKMSSLADTGLTSADELGYLKAQNMGHQMSKSATDAALANAAARGVGGSGLEFAMREIGNQGGAQRAQEAALQQAADAAKQRASYEMAYNSALNNQRGQDFSMNKTNADIINQFNQANTGITNSARQSNTSMRNAAQQYNQQGARDTQQQNYDNEFKRRAAVAGQYGNVANSHLAASAAANSQANAILSGAAQAGAAYAGGSAKKPKEEV